ncbi:hypothetical protein J5N97_025007 [Dioscorea zingiberensis]|uniref:MYB transcription factor n=1 Tax=Dioscorea zingiberensis TaxID=325984 RepID=A0A9D5C819_9LILI|nr:hypothetical protein J5N97_025007 [Dioscorea zingiberensis]
MMLRIKLVDKYLPAFLYGFLECHIWAPKQKMDIGEESALKAGVVKHGAGKWRTILKDPEFSSVLCLRSNVDLKDKWRNMSVVANGWGSREKARIAFKKTITILKEPTGSNKDQHYPPPPDLKRRLSAKLKALTACRKLVKVKRKYRIAPDPAFFERRSSEGRQRGPCIAERDDFKPLLKSQIDAELARIRNMTAEEAAAAAAQAVAEAEAAMTEARKAAKEAEAAEADAQEAQAFAEAAMRTLKNRSAARLTLRV